MNRAYNHPDAVPAEEMNRRVFLKLCAVGALPGLLAACQSGPSKPGVTNLPSPTRQPSPTSNDWTELASSLQGTLVRPDSPYYPTARQLFNPRFDSVQPAGIAYCASPADVRACLAFVRRFGLPLASRSGGHSYAGYSTTTGLVLDVTLMNTVNVDAGTRTAIVGAGTRLIDVYAALAQHGLVLPAGSCPTVGIAGLTLGGGVGVLGRKFGLTCDNLLAAQVVVADGRVLTCDASHNPNLFWALRGGGGGNFGVVTTFTFRVHPAAILSLFTLRWPWSSAAAVIDAWQGWASQAPDELWSNCLLQATGDRGRDKSGPYDDKSGGHGIKTHSASFAEGPSDPTVEVNGVYVGDVAPLGSLLQLLTSRIDAIPTSRYVWNAGLLETMLYEANCYDKTMGECHLANQDPQGQLPRAAYSSKSDYFTSPLPRKGIDNLVNAIARSQFSTTLGEGGIGLDAFGGAINRMAANATAFVHRNALFSAQYTANWNASDSASSIAAKQAWLTDLWQSMRQFASGSAYQNYIDPDLVNWQQAYYGANLTRLQHVKATYDPEDLFHFAQSIPLMLV